MTSSVRLVLTEELRRALIAHLFPGDGDEHGAVLLAGIARDGNGIRLLGRELIRADDGVDYVPGQRGYRMLTAEFVGRAIRRARNERLAYLAIHNHASGDRATFSGDDMRSHERGYPALLAIARGLPVGALVVAQQAVAGDIWLTDGARLPVELTVVVGARRTELRPAPGGLRDAGIDAMFHRQSLMFGPAGQARLRAAKVGIIGSGGAGMLLVEWLARLGVGELIVADPDRVHPTNLPRLPGASRSDALNPFRSTHWPAWLRRLGARLDRPKVELARRLVLRTPGPTKIRPIFGDIRDPDVAAQFIACDFLLLAADPDQARLVANAICQRYLIPGASVGSKVNVEVTTGEVQDVFAVMRPIQPGAGCLWCNGIISGARLAEESATDGELRAQRYVDDPLVTAPSVITLNATASALAANRMLFYLTGLHAESLGNEYVRIHPLTGRVRIDEPSADPRCPECGRAPDSAFARGDGVALPTRLKQL
jgi:molybdopterin/thiamine biosynthesis adenylyltransferase